MRPVLKIPLLHDDEAAVITTKLMIPAPAGIPIFSKTKTNGLVWHDPSRRIICVSYSGDLAKKHANDFRAVLESP